MGPITGAIVDLLAKLSGLGVAAFPLCCNALFSALFSTFCNALCHALFSAVGVGPKALVFSPQ